MLACIVRTLWTSSERLNVILVCMCFYDVGAVCSLRPEPLYHAVTLRGAAGVDAFILNQAKV